MVRVLESSVAFNIKNPEVDRLVREVCSRTGESLTTAIEVALRERLDRLDAVRGQELDDAIAWLQERFRHAPYPSMEAFDAEHYDEMGLPQ